MNIKFKYNNTNYDLNIKSAKNWDSLISAKDRSLNCTIKINDELYDNFKKDSARKGYAIWIPFKKDLGIKILAQLTGTQN